MRLLPSSRTNQGTVLLVCLCLAVVLGIGVASSLILVRSQNLSVARSQAWNDSLVVAEAGVEDGMALINKNSETLIDPTDWVNTATYDNWTVSGNVFHVRRNLGLGSGWKSYYDVYITNQNNQPVIRSIGTKVWESPYRGQTILQRCVVVKAIPSSLFEGGIIAKDGVAISGNALIDSFNSQDTNYSTGGQYDPTKRSDGGDVATTQSNVVAAVSVDGSVLIYGKIYTGPSDTVVLSGNNVSVGGMTWVPTSGVQSNWVQNDLNITINDAPPPPSGIPLPSMQSNTVDGTNYNNSILLTDGSYQSVNLLSLASSQSIIVDGNASVYFESGFSLSGQSFIYITPGSSLTIWSGDTVYLGGGGVMNGTGYATNLTLYGTSTCTNITYSGGSDFLGTIYAPYADFIMTGGGNKVYNLTGSVVANDVTINGNYQIHYDESLVQPRVGANYYASYWMEVPP